MGFLNWGMIGISDFESRKGKQLDDFFTFAASYVQADGYVDLLANGFSNNADGAKLIQHLTTTTGVQWTAGVGEGVSHWDVRPLAASSASRDYFDSAMLLQWVHEVAKQY